MSLTPERMAQAEALLAWSRSIPYTGGRDEGVPASAAERDITTAGDCEPGRISIAGSASQPRSDDRNDATGRTEGQVIEQPRPYLDHQGGGGRITVACSEDHSHAERHDRDVDAARGLVCFFAFDGECDGALVVAGGGSDSASLAVVHPTAYCAHHASRGQTRAHWTGGVSTRLADDAQRVPSSLSPRQHFTYARDAELVAV